MRVICKQMNQMSTNTSSKELVLKKAASPPLVGGGGNRRVAKAKVAKARVAKAGVAKARVAKARVEESLHCSFLAWSGSGPGQSSFTVGSSRSQSVASLLLPCSKHLLKFTKSPGSRPGLLLKKKNIQQTT